MADEAPPNDNTPPPAQPAPATPAAPTITPDIEALIVARETQARNAAWAEARRTFEAKKPSGGQQPKPETPAATQAATLDAFAILQLRDDFDDAISDLTLTGGQKKLLRGWVMEKRPEDVGGYVRSVVEQAGWTATKTPPPSTPAAPAAAPATPAAPPVTGNGAPSNPTNVITADVPLYRLGTADQIALRKQIGDKAFTERMMKEFREHGTRVRLR